MIHIRANAPFVVCGDRIGYKDRRANAPDKNRSAIAIPYLKIPNRYLIMAGGYSISSIQ